jgi:hypothetical protein
MCTMFHRLNSTSFYSEASRSIPTRRNLVGLLCVLTPFNTFLGGFAKFQKESISFACLSVRPHGATLLSNEEFSRNFTFKNFSKICRENSRLIKT